MGIDIRKLRNEELGWQKLQSLAKQFFGDKWKPSYNQREALKREARHLGINVYEGRIHWRPKQREPFGRTTKIDFSRRYPTYSHWYEKTHSSAYKRRIANYMRSHPNATLKQARGHSRR